MCRESENWESVNCPTSLYEENWIFVRADCFSGSGFDGQISTWSRRLKHWEGIDVDLCWGGAVVCSRRGVASIDKSFQVLSHLEINVGPIVFGFPNMPEGPRINPSPLCYSGLCYIQLIPSFPAKLPQPPVSHFLNHSSCLSQWLQYGEGH